MAGRATIARPKWYAIMIVPLTLSTFTHLWNPVGFPDIFYDEGIYMRRTMHVMEGLGPQEGTFYDHPYFGQFFMAGALSVIGYPGSLQSDADIESVSTLYMAPRLLMGLLTVVDTFLVFKIAERRYGTRVALIASVLFAVMPLTWFMRRILLDSILLPFLLSSVLFATYASGATGGKRTAFVLLSGAFLGTAIFTKVPIFTMIPLVAYLVYSVNANHRLKNLGMWFIPVILIPLIWPAYSASQGQLDYWMRDVLWQTQREGKGLWSIVMTFYEFDPVLLILGAAGTVFAAAKRQMFILLWAIPFIALLSAIGYVQYFHWIPIIPVFCIAAGVLIEKAAKINTKVPYVVISGIGAFGLVSTAMLITTDVTSAQFEALAFVADYADDKTTIVASPVYAWALVYIFDKEHVLSDYRDLLFRPVETEKILLVSDNHFQENMTAGEQLKNAYDSTTLIETFEGNVAKYDFHSYPYTSMSANYEGEHVEIRIGG